VGKKKNNIPEIPHSLRKLSGERESAAGQRENNWMPTSSEIISKREGRKEVRQLREKEKRGVKMNLVARGRGEWRFP